MRRASVCVALLGVSVAARAETNTAEQAFFLSLPHALLDFTLDGDGQPVLPPGGSFDMLTEYAPLGLQFDSSAFGSLQWRMTADLPDLTGSVLGAVSEPVIVASFGLTVVRFETPVRAAGVTVVLRDLPASFFLTADDANFVVDESFVIATEEIDGVTHRAVFLGVVSDAPFSIVSFGIPEGGEYFIDDIRYTGAACAADLSMDGMVDGADLAALLADWGGSGGFADINGDGVVDGADLAAMLAVWGDCR